MTAAYSVTVADDYVIHPVAEMFPLISGSEFDLFVEDIRANGQMEPIVLDADGRLIDGRNRMRACIELGIEPRTKVYEGEDVTAYIVSHNIHRRHLTDSQRAMIAAKLATRKPGMTSQPDRISSIADSVPTQAEAGELLSVPTRAVGVARVVLREGLPQLQDLVAEGHAPVTTAARVATEMDFAGQKEYVDRVRAGADPVKCAPPDLKQAEKSARRAERVGAPAPKPSGAKHADVIASVNNTMRVWRENNLTFTELDSSVTAEKAAQLVDDLSASIKRLIAVRRLLNNRMKESTE